MRRRRRFLAAALLLGLGACADFGDKIYDFVVKNARPMSVEHANADLPDRWMSAHKEAVTGLYARIVYASTLMGQVHVPDEGTSPAEALEQTNDQLRVLLALDGEVERLQTALDTWTRACDSRQLFDDLGLNRISTIAPVQPVVAANYSIEFTFPNVFEGPWNSLVNNLSAINVDEQNRRAAQAIERFGELAIQGSNLFALSQTACKEAAKDYEPTAKEIKRTLASMVQASDALRATLSVEKQALEEKLVPADIERLLRERGIDQKIVRVEKERFSQDVIAGLGRAWLSFTRRTEAVKASHDCEARISGFEGLEDSYVVGLAQIEALLSEPGDLTAVVQDRLRSRKSEWSQALAEVKKTEAAYARKGCRGGR